MKKKLYTRPVSVTLSDEMFEHIKEITDSVDISISDYIRVVLQDRLVNEKTRTIVRKEK